MKAKQLLDEQKVVYKFIDVTVDREGREQMVQKSGQMGVPVIEIDGEIAVGFDKNWIEEKLASAD
ncbi:MAG TPA: glutaredoxin family protein [Dehalococcoidia bacterium]|nr:glutaredoxin family protein [Dehalococcoidia bacterium]